MEKNVIIDALIRATGTDINNARLLADDLMELQYPFDELLDRWLKNPKDIGDYTRKEISISKLMSEAGLTYPAALSTMNWILCEGDEAYDYVKSAI